MSADKIQRMAALSVISGNRIPPRPSWNQYFLMIAKIVSSRGSCVRRKVGSVLVNGRNQILSTGYNGKASGLINCLDVPCSGAKSPSGTNLDGCEALHAEWNALLQCPNAYEIKKAYVTTAPCVTCVKMFLNTSCQEIVFIEDYPHSTESKRIWEKAGRTWTQENINE